MQEGYHDSKGQKRESAHALIKWTRIFCRDGEATTRFQVRHGVLYYYVETFLDDVLAVQGQALPERDVLGSVLWRICDDPEQ